IGIKRIVKIEMPVNNRKKTGLKLFLNPVFLSWILILIFIHQDPISFVKKRNGLFVFHLFIFSAQNMFDSHPIISSDFWPIPNDGFCHLLMLRLSISGSSGLGRSFIHVWNFLFFLAQFLFSANFSCFLNLLLILSRQFSFEQERNHILIDFFNHLFKQFESFKLVNQKWIFLFVNRQLNRLLQFIHLSKMGFPGIIDNGKRNILLEIQNKLFSFTFVSFFQICGDI